MFFRYNPGRQDPIKNEERKVEDTENFVCLGAKVDKQGGTDSGIKT